MVAMVKPKVSNNQLAYASNRQFKFGGLNIKLATSTIGVASGAG